MTLFGVDVSSNNAHPIDWTQVRAIGHRFAIIKATEGATYFNPWFTEDWTNAKAAGLVTIAYHFARPSRNSAAAEASYFLSHLPELQPGDGVALDIEDTGVPNGESLLNWTLTWLSLVSAGTGVMPLFYSGWWYMGEPPTDHGLHDSDQLAAVPLWYASYQAQRPPVPANWADITIWQSGQANVPGIVGAVDVDQTELTIEQLRALGKAAPPAPTPDPVPVPDDLVARVGKVETDLARLNAVLTWRHEGMRTYLDPQNVPPEMEVVNG